MEKTLRKTKRRRAVIYRQKVYDQIDAMTHKAVEAAVPQATRQSNAVSSDTQENLDGGLVARYVALRDAILRKHIAFALAPRLDVADNNISNLGEVLVYDLVVGEDFDDNMLEPVTEMIHTWLVYGALYDWYRGVNHPLAASYLADAETLLEDITAQLRGRSFVRRPLQPFGPRYKSY